MDGDVATASPASPPRRLASSPSAAARAMQQQPPVPLMAAVAGTANSPLAHRLPACRGRRGQAGIPTTSWSGAGGDGTNRQGDAWFAALLRDERRRDKRAIGESIRRRVERDMEACDEDLECRRDRLRELLLRDEARLTRELVEAGRRQEESRTARLQARAAEAEEEREEARRELLREKRLQLYAAENLEEREARRRARAADSKRANLAQMEEAEERRRMEREDEEYWHAILLNQCESDDTLEAERSRRRAEHERRVAAELRSQIQTKSHCDQSEKQQRQQQQSSEDAGLWKLEDEREVAERRRAKSRQLRAELETQLSEARECLARRRSEEAQLERMMSSSLDKDGTADQLMAARRDKEARRGEILTYMRNMREFREAVARREAETDECTRRWAAEAEAARREAQSRAKEDRRRRVRELRLAWDRQHEEKTDACRQQQDNCEPAEEAVDHALEVKAERARRRRTAQEYGRELLAQRDWQEASRACERRALDEHYELQRLEREREERRLAQELNSLGSRLRISGVP